MAENRPLSYSTWEYVLPYFDLNNRNSLSKRCPSLQLHRSNAFNSPIVIQNMEVTPMKIKIEDTTYKVGIIQQYNDGKNPEIVQNRNDSGGFLEEVDKYGLKPSAVSNLDGRRVDFVENDNSWRGERQIQYDLWEEERRKCEKLEEGLFKRMSMLRINRKVREVNAKYLPIELKMSGGEPPFSQYIQFKILKPGTKPHIERLKYSTGDLYKSMDNIFKKLFENKTGTIKNLTIDWKMLQKFEQFLPILENFSIEKSTLLNTSESSFYNVHDLLQNPHFDEATDMPFDPLYLSMVKMLRTSRREHHLTYGEFDYGPANLAMANIFGLENTVKMEKEELRETKFPNVVVIRRNGCADIQMKMVVVQKPDGTKKYMLHIDKMEEEQWL